MSPVLGSWTNHVGRAANIATPSGSSQSRAFSGALKAAKVTADQISYIEAHGTGTPLGDPIELRALASVFSVKPHAVGSNDGEIINDPIILGSSKASLGHLESVSGIAGLIKAILLLRHREAPPQIHFRELNPEIERGTRNLKFRIITSDTAPDDRLVVPRGQDAERREEAYALVSSFGFSGTNASVVLASPPTAALPTAGVEAGERLRGNFYPWHKSVEAHPFLNTCRHTWVDASEAVKAAYIQIGRYSTVWNQLGRNMAKPLTQGDDSYFPAAVILELILATADKAIGHEHRGRHQLSTKLKHHMQTRQSADIQDDSGRNQGAHCPRCGQDSRLGAR
jgi:hypothetical protein